MKISMIGTLPPIKGLSDYCVGLIESLAQHVDIDFINFVELYPEKYYPGGTKKGEYKIKSNNVTVYDIIKWYNPMTWVKSGLIPKTKIVHVQWWALPLAPIFLTILTILKMRNKITVVTLHNITPHEKSNFFVIINKLIIKLSDYIVIHSKNNISILKNIYKTDRNITVIPHGSISKTNYSNSYERILNILKLNTDDRNILFFGNIRDYKGLDVLLESIGILVNEYQCKKIKCIVAGQLWEPWEKYQDIINKLNISQYVSLYLNFIPDDQVDAFFRASYVVVLPYKYFDSQSGVGSIALNYDVPILVTRVGGLLDYASYEESIANPRDPVDLAEKLLAIITDDNLYNKLKEDAMKKRELFSWGNVSKLTYKLYTQIDSNK